jgi:hypothetical protein
MTLSQIGYVGVILLLTVLSGYADSRGFLHAANIWVAGALDWGELGKSALGFAIGISLYWLALRFLPYAGIAASPEMQTLGWFIVTITGVAISSGEFAKWPLLDQAVGVGILVGMGWLFFQGH